MRRYWVSWFVSLAVVTLIVELFFDRWWLVILCWPFGLLLVRMDREIQNNANRIKLRLYFKQFLMILQTSLATGQSLESALTTCSSELTFMFPHDRHPFLHRLHDVKGLIRSGTTAESTIMTLCDDNHNPDLKQFAETVLSVKRKSGDLLDTVRKTSQILSEKMDVEQDIQLSIANKTYEARLMLCIPLLLLASIKWSAPEYMHPLYHEPIGLVVASVTFVMYWVCFYGVERLLRRSWEE
jgi:tight adherence protein B